LSDIVKSLEDNPLACKCCAIELLNSLVAALSCLHQDDTRQHAISSDFSTIDTFGAKRVEKRHDHIVIELGRDVGHEEYSVSRIFSIIEIRRRDAMRRQNVTQILENSWD